MCTKTGEAKNVKIVLSSLKEKILTYTRQILMKEIMRDEKYEKAI